MTLDASAATAGFASVFGGSGALTLEQGAGDSLGLYIDGSANTLGGNLFVFDAASLVGGDSVKGSGLNDTLAVAGTGLLQDSVFIGLSGISVLALHQGGAVTLDASAATAGFASVYGGAGGLTLDQGVGETLGLYIDGSGNASGGNLFVFDTASLVGGDTVRGEPERHGGVSRPWFAGRHLICGSERGFCTGSDPRRGGDAGCLRSDRGIYERVWGLGCPDA